MLRNVIAYGSCWVYKTSLLRTISARALIFNCYDAYTNIVHIDKHTHIHTGATAKCIRKH